MITIEEGYQHLDIILKWGSQHYFKDEEHYEQRARFFLENTKASVFNFTRSNTLLAGCALIHGLHPHLGFVIDVMVLINPVYEGDVNLMRTIVKQIRSYCKQSGIDAYVTSKHISPCVCVTTIHNIGS